jgi:tetratricopeptide (TPR) repeat protein
VAQLLSGAGEGAMEDCARALERDSLSPWARTVRGLALLDAGKADEAVVDLTTALGASPDLVVARLGRAVAHAAAGRYERAVEDLSRVLELEPENADAFAVRGEYHSLLGRYAEAAADYDQAMKLGGLSGEITLRYLLSLSRTTGAPPAEGAATEGSDTETSPGEAEREGADTSSAGLRGFLDRLLGRPIRETKVHRAAQARVPWAVRAGIG